MSWATQQERGGHTALRLVVHLALLVGPAATRAMVAPAALWFLLFDAGARAASRAFLARALPHAPNRRDVFRHFLSFATAIADRVFLLAGAPSVRVDTEGLHHLDELERQNRGCILLGAHLGSFEALRALARRSPVPIRALMFRDNAGALTRVLEAIDPCVGHAVIPIGRPDAMLEVRECLAAGGVVGMLADRTPNGERTVSVPFLGAPALFPAGPFVVASVLGAPVLLVSAVRTGPGRYRVSFEPFAERVVLRRTHRAADLHAIVARFAARLDLMCRQHPYEWFNFFPFWPDAGPAHASGRKPVSPRTPVPAGLRTAE